MPKPSCLLLVLQSHAISYALGNPGNLATRGRLKFRTYPSPREPSAGHLPIFARSIQDGAPTFREVVTHGTTAVAQKARVTERHLPSGRVWAGFQRIRPSRTTGVYFARPEVDTCRSAGC